jgi:hypothetical protein
LPPDSLPPVRPTPPPRPRSRAAARRPDVLPTVPGASGQAGLVNVSIDSATAGGTVEVFNGTTKLGQGTVIKGKASVANGEATVSLGEQTAIGTRQVTVDYYGDATHKAGSSTATALTVVKQAAKVRALKPIRTSTGAVLPVSVKAWSVAATGKVKVKGLRKGTYKATVIYNGNALVSGAQEGQARGQVTQTCMRAEA